MTRTLIPSPRHSEILKRILIGNPLRQIAKELKINPGNLTRTVNRLVRDQYLIRVLRSNHVQYGLTLKGYGLLSDQIQRDNMTENNPHVIRQKTALIEKPKKYWRLHRLQFKIPYVNPLKSSSIHLIELKDHPVKLRRLYNHDDLIVQFQDFVCTLTTRALKISGIQIRVPYEEVEDPQVLLDRAAAIFAPEIENLERMFRKFYPEIRLRRMANNVFDIRIAIGELAIEADELAMNVDKITKQTGQKLRIYDPEDKKLSLIVDNSFGPEFESVHPRKFMDNMEIYQSFLTDLVSGKFYGSLNEISEGLKSLQEEHKKSIELQANGYKQSDDRIMQVVDLIEKLALTVNRSISELTERITQFKGGT